MEAKKRNLLIMIAGAVIIISLAFAVFYFVQKAKAKDAEVAEIVEQMNFEKQQVEKEFTDMNQEFDGYTSNIHNDSLVKLQKSFDNYYRFERINKSLSQKSQNKIQS